MSPGAVCQYRRSSAPNSFLGTPSIFQKAKELSFPRKTILLDNNSASSLVFASGKPRVLLIENDTKEARHLATALELREDLPDLDFATHDAKLAVAATSLEFSVIGA